MKQRPIDLFWDDPEPCGLTREQDAASARLLGPGAWRPQKRTPPWLTLALLFAAGVVAGLIVEWRP